MHTPQVGPLVHHSLIACFACIPTGGTPTTWASYFGPRPRIVHSNAKKDALRTRCRELQHARQAAGMEHANPRAGNTVCALSNVGWHVIHSTQRPCSACIRQGRRGRALHAYGRASGPCAMMHKQAMMHK
eukprot:jgi/Ulvmu1/11259/UM073_0031.1